jgi:hypothetical protein
MTQLFSCRKCLPVGTAAVLYLLSFIAMLVVVRLMGHFTLTDNLGGSKRKVDTSNASFKAQESEVETALPITNNQEGLEAGSTNNPFQPSTLARLRSGLSLQSLKSILVRAFKPSEELTPSDVCKTMVLYLQYLLLVSKMSIDWPVTLTYPFAALSWLWATSSSEVLSLECVLGAGSAASGNPSVPIQIQRVMLYILGTVALLIVLLLLELVVTRAVRFVLRPVHGTGLLPTSSQPAESCPLPEQGPEVIPDEAAAAASVVTPTSLGLRCAVLAMVALYVFLPTMIRGLLSMFMCVGIDNIAYIPYGGFTAAAPGSHWAYDLNQVCWKGYHRAWALGFALPLSLLLCVVLPVVLAGFLLFNTAKLQNAMFQARYGFLYHDYKPKCCAWESVVILQTVVVVCIAVFGYSMGAYYQALVMNAALACTLMLQVVLTPYHSTQLHRLRMLSCCCLLFTSYVAMSFLPFGTLAQSSVYKLAMGSVLLVVNLVFVLYALVMLLKAAKWHIVKATVTATCVWFRRACGSCAPARKPLQR